MDLMRIGGREVAPVVGVNQSARLAAVQYVAARGKNGRPISTERAVRALRAVLRDCPLTDRELVDIVAEAAVANGCVVEFDCGSARAS